MFELERDSRLAFPIAFKAHALDTVGSAIDLFAKLSPEQIDRHYWHRAVLTMQVAIKCRQYLKTATINLETAGAMEAYLAGPEARPPNALSGHR